MDNVTSIKIGEAFGRCHVECYGKSLESRKAALETAYKFAKSLCKSEADLKIVECRFLEAQLTSGMMNNRLDEVLMARSFILTSGAFSESRRVEMVDMADQFLARQS